MFAGTTCRAMLARFWQVAVQPGRTYTPDMVNQYQLTHKEVDDVLRRNECSKQLQTFIRSYDANQLPANSPCEDQRSEAYCRLDNSYFFGVFDGHGGQACADAVSKRVYDYMAVSLMPKSLINQVASGSHPTVVEMLGSSSQHPMVESMKTAHLDNIQKFASEYLQNISSACNVRQAFKKAFQALDDDLVREAVPDSPHTANADAFEAGKSGSCACVAYIKGQDLYIAQLGDSAAILGVCSDDGVWTARKLTQVHTVDNGNEVKRVRAEHPASESLSVLRGERLLGELFPLRAFGDMRFKLPAQTLKSITSGGDGALPLPANYFTPPYLTAEPSVYYYRLTVNDKFLVIGSDGFWDMVTPEAAVCFASDHMIGFETLVPYLRPSEATFRQVLNDLMIRKERSKKRPADANGATHLIRHALTSEFAEGNPYAGLSYVLSIPKGVARAYRDDITVSVIYFRPV